jgi:hypothetical protein
VHNSPSRSEIYNQFEDEVEKRTAEIRAEHEAAVRKAKKQVAEMQRQMESTIAERVEEQIAAIRPTMDVQFAERLRDEIEAVRIQIQREAEARIQTRTEEIYKDYKANIARMAEEMRRDFDQQFHEATTDVRRTIRDRYRVKFEERLAVLAKEVEVECQRKFVDEMQTFEAETEARIREDLLTNQESRLRKELEQAFRGEMEVADVNEMRAIFAELCEAAGITMTSFDVARFVRIVSRLSKEILEIRDRLELRQGSFLSAIIGLQDEVAHLDQYKTHTRGLLVMQAQRIADLKKSTHEASWVNWAKSIHTEVCGVEFEDDDCLELRLRIEERLAKILATSTERNGKSVWSKAVRDASE